jgi:methylglyoxal synthase
MNNRILSSRKQIALVAHDHKKPDLLEWVMDNRAILSTHQLFATGTTGSLVQEALNIPVVKFLSGPLGGDQQIGASIAEGKIDVLIFFWDPMESQPHDPDVKALLRVAATWNIPVACNRASADFILTSPFMQQEYKSLLTDYSVYTNRKIVL